MVPRYLWPWYQALEKEAGRSQQTLRLCGGPGEETCSAPSFSAPLTCLSHSTPFSSCNLQNTPALPTSVSQAISPSLAASAHTGLLWFFIRSSLPLGLYHAVSSIWHTLNLANSPQCRGFSLTWNTQPKLGSPLPCAHIVRDTFLS